MIVRPRPSVLGLFFILRGSIVPTIAPRIAVVAALSVIVTLLHAAWPGRVPDFTPAPFTLFGLALSIFLGFRNNACYDRWWEGRRQWGQLIAEVRGFARECHTVLPDDPALETRVVRRTVAFAHALRDQLRGLEGPEAAAWMPPGETAALDGARSKPDAVMRAIATELRPLVQAGTLSDIRYQILSQRLMDMVTIQTACERLRSTPPPFTYTLLLHRTAWLFCLLLPFGVGNALGYATPVLSVIMAYAFFGLDALGDELEEPFGQAQNALPLDAMVRSIEIAACEALGVPPPAPLMPVDHLLR